MANGIDFGTAVGLIKGLGSPDPAVIESAVNGWLDDHPEATTTVQDGSITKAKLDSNLQGTVDDVADLKSAVDAVVESVDVVNLFDNDTAQRGGINYNGGFVDTDSYYHNSFYVNEGDKIYCWAFDQNPAREIIPRFTCAYDVNGNVLTQYGDYTGRIELPYIVPAPVKRITFSMSAAAIGKIVVLKNTPNAPDEYFNGSRKEYQLKINNTNVRFYGNKVAALGDSITAQHKWYGGVNAYLNTSIVNCGVGGSKVSGASGFTSDERINSIPVDSNLVLVMGGMNDWAQNIPLGDARIDNTNIDTFCGAVNVLVQKLHGRVPTAKIICLGCTFGIYANRDEFTDKTGLYNNQGLTSIDYGRALSNMFKLNGIESYVIGEECGWNANNIANYVQFDGAYLHPNDLGGEVMADVIIRHLR